MTPNGWTVYFYRGLGLERESSALHSADDGQSNAQRSFRRPHDEHTDSDHLLVLGAKISSEWEFPFFLFFCLNLNTP